MILSRMDLSFIFFIFAAFIVIPGTFFGLALFNKYLAAGIATIGMLTLFILFGIQFFSSKGNFIEQTVPTKWPPSINMCPDYLSLYKHTDNKLYCVDTVGVSPGQKLLKYTAGGVVTPCTPASKDANNVYKSNITVGTCNGFNLYTDKPNDERRSCIIADCTKLELTFEGIFDGAKTFNNVIPKP